MTTLTTRLTKAPAPTRELLEEVFAALDGDDCGLAASNPHRNRFIAMLNAEAWTSAVEMLVPEGEFICLDGPRRYLNIPTPVPNYWRACLGYTKSAQAWGATPALALAIACLKARGLS